ncbi:hypothetical protein [Sediminispirochaeta bajacaliforniensis]|uniref:hypothetical protein n=1 Tax=Sediminispirochaeta bajacaliforniensis TaxID=148 RepID=UPI0003A9F78B|nr:hypothetical protein [Sediminispirochaeta bajacaliforniensis]
MGKGYPEHFACGAWQYLNKVVSILEPKGVMMWNGFHAFHHVLRGVCKKREINPFFMEFGSLPGTYVIEQGGQMGESYPARKYREFLNLSVTNEELDSAYKVWAYLYSSRLNRRKQPSNNNINDLKSRLKPGRPIIFYAGQNDYESGFYPYTEQTKEHHSPIFSSSDAAAFFLAELAIKNNWNLVYKPHPMIAKFTNRNFYHEQVIEIDEIDINELIDLADITVTIFSQTAYVSLIRKKPTVTLGYTQLRGKGCTYEAFDRNLVENTLIEALEKGFTSEQHTAFAKHIAQMLHYSLLSDKYSHETMSYGANIDRAVEYIVNGLNGHPQYVLPPDRTHLQDICVRSRTKDITLQELEDLIISPEIKVISFDMFDTLVCRPVLKPSDLFRLVGVKAGVGRNFADMRIAAERMAGRRRTVDRDAVTLDEIYECFSEAFDVPREIVLTLKMEELAAERRYLKPRRSAKKLYDAALKSGKSVIIVSDMYLGRDFLESVLKENGYDDFDQMYVSSDLMRSKRTGRLYEYVREDCIKKYGVSSAEILHIGDHVDVDVYKASEHGFSPIYFPKAVDRFRSVKPMKYLADSADNSMDNSFIVGYAAQMIFDDPYQKYNSKSIADGKWRNLGTILYGPLLTIFTKWLIEKSIKQKVDKIFFLLRDGYIPEKLFGIMAPIYKIAPEHAPLNLNRALMYPFSALQKKGALFCANKKYSISRIRNIEQFIEKRLMVDEPEEKEKIFEIFSEAGFGRGSNNFQNALQDAELMSRLDPVFHKYVAPHADAMRRYLLDALKGAENPALFDTGYRGRASIFFWAEFGLDLIEYHILARPELALAEAEGREIHSLAHLDTREISEAEILHIFMDDCLSEQESGIAGIESYNDGICRWQYEPKDCYDEGINFLQESILKFCEGFTELCGEDLKLLKFDSSPLIAGLKDFYTVSYRKDLLLFKNMRTPSDASFVNSEKKTNYRDWYTQHLKRFNAEDSKSKALQKPENNKKREPQVKSIIENRRFFRVKKVLKKIGLLHIGTRVYHKIFG